MASPLSLSSSFLKKSHKKTTIALDDLPEDLLVKISSCIAASSLSDVRNFRLVSKSFRQTCDDQNVISQLSLREIPFFPWFHNPERFSNFFKRCRKNGNPEALYRKGLINYFLENQKNKGLEFLAKSSQKGNKEATYLYGLILICLGDKTKQKGFKILSSLIKLLMSNTMKELVELRNVRVRLMWRGKQVMKELKGTYVREMCECDGRTKRFLVNNCVWHRYGEDNDMTTSSVCEFCLWHHEIELFFDKIE